MVKELLLIANVRVLTKPFALYISLQICFHDLPTLGTVLSILFPQSNFYIRGSE